MNKIVVSVVAFLLSIVLLIVVLLSGGNDDDDDTNDAAGGTLKAGSVPHGWAPWVQKAGAICPEIPAPIIAAQIEAESQWNPRAVSPVGAVGLSQFMPATWRGIGRDDDGNGTASPYDPGDAIMAQGRYDCQLVSQLRGKVSGNLTELALAAYNAGVGAVLNAHGIPPYPETQAYVPKIMAASAKYRQAGSGSNAPATGKAADVIAILRTKLGTPYAYGGGGINGPGPGQYGGTIGWDCSSFMQWGFYHGAGITLPRTSQEQATVGTSVSRADMKPGDLVIFGATRHHVGIYIGNGQMINEPSTGEVAKVSTIVGNSYWEGEAPWTIRRVLTS